MDLTREVKENNIDIGNLVEITLLKGVMFNMQSSSFPCAYRPEKPTTESGEKIAGYIACYVFRDSDVQECDALDLKTSMGEVGIGGFRVYSRAIHSIMKKY